MDKSDSLGYWVRRRRKSLDLTQEELAGRVGCAVVTLRKIEADQRHPSRQMAERLALCLALPPDEKTLFLAVAAGERPMDRLYNPPESPGSITAVRSSAGSYAVHKLPAPMTSLIGRTAELAAIVNCLRRRDVRLHILTGPVGVGKTRLAIEAGLRLQQELPDGVYLVALASIQDPMLVPSVTATVLGVREMRGRSIVQSVVDYLADKEILLIFDNFEHLRPAANFLSGLLECAPGLRMLVTSRAILHLYGEHEYVLAPMPVPEANSPSGTAEAASVRLFCERAQAARADFYLTPDLIPIVVQICRRLDGLPLAIELAAARIKLFSPQELLERLERRLPLLTQGTTDLPPHTQVLINAIAWSYGLLSPSERMLLNRLAVFLSGFNHSAAEAVCSFPFSVQVFFTGRETTLALPEITHGLTVLLDHSLLLRQEVNAVSGSRFVMLEIIRDYALEQLKAVGELELLQRRHAEYFTDWAEQAVTHLYGPEQAVWLKYMELEADNLRAALSWSLAVNQGEMAVRIACALGVFCRRRGYYSEGRAWLEQVLPHMEPACLPEALRARTLQTAGSLAYRQGDSSSARQWLEESLALFRTCADRPGISRVLFDLGWIAIDQAEWSEAAQFNQESLALAREGNDPLGMYRALTNLGWTRLCTGEQSQAAELFGEANEIAGRLGHTKGIAVSLTNLAWIALYQEDLERASDQATAGLRLCHLLGEKEVLVECLEILVIAATMGGQLEHAARLSGAVQALWDALKIQPSTTQHSILSYKGALETLRKELPRAVFASAWQDGKEKSLDATVIMALDHSHAY